MTKNRPLLRLHGHTFLPRFLNRDSIVVDLGGNRGVFAQDVTARFGCRCHVVEPTPDLFQSIPETNRIRKFQYAVHSSDADVTFHLDANCEASSLLNGHDSTRTRSITVSGITLETFVRRHDIPRIDLLKVDIEGAEVGMFDAAADATLRAIPQITIEFHDFNGVVAAADIHRLKERFTRLGFHWINFARRFNEDVLIVNARLCGLSSPQYWWYRHAVRNALGVNRLVRRRLEQASSLFAGKTASNV